MSRTTAKRTGRGQRSTKPSLPTQPGLRDGSAVNAKGRERVDAILAAARSIIALEGYSHLTMRRVAAAAGISLGNLQYYFTGKAELVRGLLAELISRSNEGVAALERAAPTGDREQQFLSFIDFMLAGGREPIIRGLVLQFWALASNDEAIARTMEEDHDHYSRAIAVAIQKVNPALDGPTVRLRSLIIRSMVEGTIFALLSTGGVLSPTAGLYKRVRREALRVAKRGQPQARASHAAKISDRTRPGRAEPVPRLARRNGAVRALPDDVT